VRRALVAIFLLACLALPGQALAARGEAGIAERLAQREILDLNSVLAGARENLAEAAEVPSVQAHDPACETDLQPFDDRRYTAVGAGDLDGNLFCFTSGLPSPVNIADRAYFLRTLGTRDLGVGDYQIGRSTGIGSFGLGYPITDAGSGEITGVVISPIALPWLQGRIERRASAKSVDNLILDDHGTVLARTGDYATEPGTNLGRNKLVKAVLTDDFGFGDFKLAGDRVATAWGTAPLSDGELHIAVSVPR
jgi:hypothetical protein